MYSKSDISANMTALMRTNIIDLLNTAGDYYKIPHQHSYAQIRLIYWGRGGGVHSYSQV